MLTFQNMTVQLEGIGHPIMSWLVIQWPHPHHNEWSLHHCPQTKLRVLRTMWTKKRAGGSILTVHPNKLEAHPSPKKKKIQCSVLFTFHCQTCTTIWAKQHDLKEFWDPASFQDKQASEKQSQGGLLKHGTETGSCDYSQISIRVAHIYHLWTATNTRSI